MPRTCQWPADPDGITAFLAGVEGVTRCGTRSPSFQATQDATADAPHVVDICDRHVPDAEAAGWTVGPYTASRTRARVEETPGEAPQDSPAEDAVRLALDPRTELDAMANIVEILDVFGEDAQRRVVTWAADFYGVQL